jgi:tetraacyldisaccharide 4'-kinase
MTMLGRIYGAVVRTKNALHDRGTLRTRRLQGPVVSVGNIAVGGSGKTPFVILLGELLKARSISLDVLSRGYGRSSTGVLLVDPQGSPQEFGDEPLLIAQRLQVPVVVGEKRFAAGKFAEARFGPQVHILDDGFQHRALARNLDIVLVNQSDFQDQLLPKGRLRESLAALKRADVIVMEESTKYLPSWIGGKTIWRIRRGLTIPRLPTRVVAFCGIARPERFFAELRQAGVAAAMEVAYGDHYSYTEKDVRHLLALQEEKNCGGFVTTEKDVINLKEHAALLQPLFSTTVTMELLRPELAMDLLLKKIATISPGV